MNNLRTALVTGAARGIGYGIVSKLVDAGLQVVMVDRDETQLEHAASKFSSKAVLPIVMDISESNAAEKLSKIISKTWDSVSILVNNAAISPKYSGKAAGLEEVTPEEWTKVFDVNVTAAMLLSQYFITNMRKSGWGRIVNISSRAGRSNANAAGPAYMMSKSAILGLTRSIASEYGKFGITANSVAPGLIETELSRTVSPELLEQIRTRIAIGRPGLPEEIGATVAFLVSQDAGFINGSCLDVNGGAFMC